MPTRRRSDDPVPLPSGETLQFMQGLWQLAHALDVRSRRMMRTLGVTGPPAPCLADIGHAPDLGAGELAATLGMHPSTMTGVLARLERQRLIERYRDPGDGRRSRTRLTADGRRSIDIKPTPSHPPRGARWPVPT